MVRVYFSQSGGTNGTVLLGLGGYSGASGAYTISGGTLNVSDFYTGYEGTGTFTVIGDDPAMAMVPEPTVLALMLAGGLVLLRKRIR